jgi:hypothetical protein
MAWTSVLPQHPGPQQDVVAAATLPYCFLTDSLISSFVMTRAPWFLWCTPLPEHHRI